MRKGKIVGTSFNLETDADSSIIQVLSDHMYLQGLFVVNLPFENTMFICTTISQPLSELCIRIFWPFWLSLKIKFRTSFRQRCHNHDLYTHF